MFTPLLPPFFPRQAFTTAVAEFDAMTRLDNWKTAMLIKVKARLRARATGAEPDEDEEDEVL